MKEIALSIDKMLHLQELGLDCSKASMHYQYLVTADGIMNGSNELEKDPSLFISQKNMKHKYPAFCLSDILELLPDDLRITKDTIMNKPYYVGNFMSNFCDFNFDGNSLLEMAYEILYWCIENGYVKTK